MLPHCQRHVGQLKIMFNQKPTTRLQTLQLKWMQYTSNSSQSMSEHQSSSHEWHGP